VLETVASVANWGAEVATAAEGDMVAGTQAASPRGAVRLSAVKSFAAACLIGSPRNHW
jgi:hypothetical protein